MEGLKLPKHVTILGKKYRVVTKIDSQYTAKYETDGMYLYGLFIPVIDTIYINPALNIKDQIRTLTHEMGHALIARSGIAVTCSLSYEMEEMIVENYSNMMCESLGFLLK